MVVICRVVFTQKLENQPIFSKYSLKATFQVFVIGMWDFWVRKSHDESFLLMGAALLTACLAALLISMALFRGAFSLRGQRCWNFYAQWSPPAWDSDGSANALGFQARFDRLVFVLVDTLQE